MCEKPFFGIIDNKFNDILIKFYKYSILYLLTK